MSYSAMYVLYSAAVVAFFVLTSPYLLYQVVRYSKYVRSLPQRLRLPPLSVSLDGTNRSGSTLSRLAKC